MVVLNKDVQELRGFVAYNRNLKCRINPLVPISILDAFTRNREEKVVGTLLGYMIEGNIVEIVDCYTVAHSNEDDQVLLDQDYHRKMATLKGQVHQKEVVVGWFSCDNQDESAMFDESTVQIHAFYTSKSQSMFNGSIGSPLHLTVNAKSYQDINVKVYTTYQTVGLDKLHQFHEVPVCESSYSQDKEIVQMVLQSATQNRRRNELGDVEEGEKMPVQELDLFVKNLDELQTLLKQAKDYTSKVVSGEEEGKAEVGRAIAAALADAAASESSTNSGSAQMKNSLMVMYLSNLAKTQITLAEKLNHELAKRAAEMIGQE